MVCKFYLYLNGSLSAPAIPLSPMLSICVVFNTDIAIDQMAKPKGQ